MSGGNIVGSWFEGEWRKAGGTSQPELQRPVDSTSRTRDAGAKESGGRPDLQSSLPPRVALTSSWNDVWVTDRYSYDSDFGVDDATLKVGGWGDSYYTLIQFEPPAKRDSPCLLRLYAQEIDSSARATRMFLDRVASPWDENVGWHQQPSAEFIRMLAAPVPGQWYEINLTDLCDSWRAGRTPNYGIRLRPERNDNRFNTFASSEATDLRPVLMR